MLKTLVLTLFLSCEFLTLRAQPLPVVLNERARAATVDEILEDRFENLLPRLMREEGVDMWVIISREYNEDPVMRTMLPSTWIAARRRTIMVFYDPGKDQPIDKLAIARYDVGTLLKGQWDLSANPDQWEALVKVIQEKNPRKIALNYSTTYGHADGLTYTEQGEFMKKLPKGFHSRIQSAERLAVRWLETRSEKEMVMYPMICRLSHQIIDETFSEKVIQPGVTTTEDVVWYLRQRVTDLGLDTWFHPTVDIQRADDARFDHLRTFSKRPGTQVILPGDLLHVDFGITYLRLNTDQQQHAYILKPGETEVPAYLRKAFEQGNRLQDILTERFKTGKTGNEILAEALQQATQEGITASIYSHPIGFHGHAAGPAIGMWDNQQAVKGTGDYPLFKQTAYSIELNVSVPINEWNKSVRIMLEEDGYYDEKGFRYIDGRQRDIFIIPRKSESIR